jgi:hypothetical protein
MVTLGGNETKVAGLWNSHDLTAEVLISAFLAICSGVLRQGKWHEVWRLRSHPCPPLCLYGLRSHEQLNSHCSGSLECPANLEYC